MIVDGNLTIKELIEKLEREIKEQTIFLNSLKKFVVVTATSNGDKSNGNSENGDSSKSAATVRPVIIAKNNNNEPTISSRAYSILKNFGKPLSQIEIRNRFTEMGIDTSKPNYTGKIYTALSRRSDLFVRLNDGRWALKEWDIDALNAEIVNETVNKLFENV